ncbi:thioredoxin family protein [Thermohalobacter berrensis]|uniref:Redox-active disulfide protein 2 n=1 Tax=Thermohalobacter berrensis TaxID=99594 RepID=A0A419SZC7_9FIRM|nr:thioredoxin family protein [Thermohalobacter berrensis]RKD30555.1 redox-active disulfide protein 2 [Thermohalobacter berrensis]
MNIKILGPGCKNCQKLYDMANEIVEELGIDAKIEKVTEFKDIASYGIMKTPGIVINEKVQVSGRVPSKKEVKELINKNL